MTHRALERFLGCRHYTYTAILDNQPTYVTYVEFCQDLTGPSDPLTTPQRRISTFVLPAKQSVLVGRVPASYRRLIWNRQHELGELALEVL